MNWFLIALFAPALWGVVNHIDKYLISKYFKGGGIGSLMIFSSLIGLFVLPFILIFEPNVLSINPINALIIVINGMIYVLGLLPYIYALEKDEASIVVPLFQLAPVFSYFLAYVVLGEILTTQQIFGSALIIFGAIGISLELNEKKTKFKKAVFWLMSLASLSFALNSLLFKFVAVKETFWVTNFWEYVGFVIFAVILLVFIKPYRRQFVSVIRKNKIPVIGLNAFNESINIVAKTMMHFASLLVPVTLALVVNGFQPFFVFTYGIILTTFFPRFGKESLEKKFVLQKVLAILVMFVGIYLLNVSV